MDGFIRRGSVVLSLVSLLFLATPSARAQAPESGAERSQWAPTASFLLGEFDTGPLVAELVEETFDFDDFEFTGRSWDIGVARGRPGHSYFRICYTEVRVQEGSFAVEGDLLTTTRDVRVRGAKIERVWYVGRASWPVAPMVSLHGGVGKVSGEVVETISGDAQVKDASEILDTEWWPIFGAGIGLTGRINDYVTITGSVAGIEFPGVYYGAVQVIVWPRRSP